MEKSKLNGVRVRVTNMKSDVDASLAQLNWIRKYNRRADIERMCSVIDRMLRHALHKADELNEILR